MMRKINSVQKKITESILLFSGGFCQFKFFRCHKKAKRLQFAYSIYVEELDAL